MSDVGRRMLSDRQALAIDVVVVLVSLSGVYREVAFPADERRMIDLPIGAYVVVQIVGALTLVWRRSRPVEVGWANAALSLISPTQASYFAAYALGVHADRRRWAIATFLAVLGGWVLGGQLWNLEDPVSGPSLLCLAGVIGMYVRARHSLYDALEERAQRAERDQEQLARAAVADERVRIANDMHDAVAHQVTLLVLQAGALSVAGPDEPTRRSAEEMRTRGVAALVELRDIIGVLRDDSMSSSLGHQAPTVAALVAVAAASGIDVRLREHGNEATVVEVAALVLRILREALTNAVKHAPGSSVFIDVTNTDAEAVVRVVNTAPASRPDRRLAATGARSGLFDLRRRIEAHGGQLDHCHQPDGGFELTARLNAASSSPSETVPAAPSGTCGTS